jgi:predicted fused transcriptional regulator/phosphomethylpyrimidine kinase
VAKLIPSGLARIGVALDWAAGPEDVASFTGGLLRRTTAQSAMATIAGCPAFGVSTKAAAVLLSARKARPEFNCVLTLPFSDKLLKAVKLAGIVAAVFDRSKQPPSLEADEAMVLEWGIMGAISSHPETAIVGAVYDRGAEGLSGTLRLLGTSGLELVEMVRAILTELD